MSTAPVVREIDRNNDPLPLYDFYHFACSMRIKYGGKILYTPTPEYIGGVTRVIDHVGTAYMSINGVSTLCDACGINGTKTFYIDDDVGGFKLIVQDEDLKQAFLGVYRSWEPNMLDLYVVVDGGIPGDESDGDEAYDERLEYFSDSEFEGASDTDVAIALDLDGAANIEGNVGVNNDAASHDEAEAEADIEEDVEEDVEEDIEEDADDDVDEVVDHNGRNVKGTKMALEDDSGDEDIMTSGDELDSRRGSEDEDNGGLRVKTFSESDVMNPKFDVGMKFCFKRLFREAVHSHAINTGRMLKIKKNDKKRIHAKCVGVVGCPWKLHAIRIPNEETFIVREYQKRHKCTSTMYLKNIKSKWIARRFVQDFKTDPTRKMRGWRQDKINEIVCDFSKYQGWRARAHAMILLHGDPKEQYRLLPDYIEEVKRTNPGSTLILGTDHSQGVPVFDRVYVCIEALKKGYNSGCRPVIGIDGCHLKGSYGGVLLTAVGIDPNNNTFPIAWATVHKETTDTWEWFLKLLRKDLKIVKVANMTIMSDKQKGLIQAVLAVFPGCEHRFCVRHLHGNFKDAGFKGDLFKIALWNAARACTNEELNVRMEEMKVLSEDARIWFNDKPASQWSKAQFRTHPKCDILLNNGCECFNACILEAREKAILSMLEWLMEYAMKRMQKNRDRALKSWDGKVCPKIVKIVEKAQANLRYYVPSKSSDRHYQVDCVRNGDRFDIDLELKTCGCRRWDLSGIPCVHALRAIGAQGLNWEDFVHQCYDVETYNNVYAPVIKPTNGRSLWRRSGLTPPLPPRVTKAAGRPKGGARRPEIDEQIHKGKRKCRGKPIGLSTIKSNTLRKMQKTCKCKFCGVIGHNSRGCQKKKEAIRNGLRDEPDLTDQAINDGGGEQNQVVEDLGDIGMFSQVPTQESNQNDNGGAGTSKKAVAASSKGKLPIRRNIGKGKATTNVTAPFKPPTKRKKKPTAFDDMSIEESSMGSKTVLDQNTATAFDDMVPEEQTTPRQPYLVSNTGSLHQLLHGGSGGKVAQNQSNVNIYGTSIRVSMAASPPAVVKPKPQKNAKK